MADRLVIDGTSKDPLAGLAPSRPDGQDMFVWEHQHCWIVKWSTDWVVLVSPMLFNDRVNLCRRDEYTDFIEAGWCYDKGGPAFMAAFTWNPDSEDTPIGFKKEAASRDRSIV